MIAGCQQPQRSGSHRPNARTARSAYRRRPGLGSKHVQRCGDRAGRGRSSRMGTPKAALEWHGRLCVKGRYGWDYAASPQRLTGPSVAGVRCGRGPVRGAGRPGRRGGRPGSTSARPGCDRRPRGGGRRLTAGHRPRCSSRGSSGCRGCGGRSRATGQAACAAPRTRRGPAENLGLQLGVRFVR